MNAPEAESGSGWPDGPGVVTLPNGARVRGRGLKHRHAIYSSEPTFGVYLLARPPLPAPAWPSEWIPWRDFRLPADRLAAVETLRAAHRRAVHGERVELACRGGVGRTGTAIAILAVLAGIDPADAVK